MISATFEIGGGDMWTTIWTGLIILAIAIVIGYKIHTQSNLKPKNEK